MSLVAFALYGGSYIASDDFWGVQDLCWGDALLFLYQVFMALVEDAGFFEVLPASTLDIPQAYQAYPRTVVLHWVGDGNVGCFQYSVDDSVVCDILGREVHGRNRFLDSEVTSVHVDTVMVSLLVKQLFILTDARDITAAAFESLKKSGNRNHVIVEMISTNYRP